MQSVHTMIQIKSLRLLDSLVVECGRSRVQSPVKDRVMPKTLLKWYQEYPCLALNIEKWKYWLFLKN